MNSEQYLRTLEEFFQGEVTGEALFHTLAEALEDPERRYQMRVLEQLECIGTHYRHCPGKGPCGHALGQSDAHLPA